MSIFVKSLVSLVFIAIFAGERTNSISHLIQSEINALRSQDDRTRLSAAQRLGEFGPGAVEAVPALVRAMDEPEIEVFAAIRVALAQVGEAAIPNLVHLMKDAEMSEKTRSNAAEALADLGPPALPHLWQALNDEDVAIQMLAIDSLPRVGVAAVVAVPDITKFIGGPNENLTLCSIVCLAQVAAHSDDPEKSPAFEALLAVIQRAEPSHRYAAVSAFKFLGDKIGPAIPSLREAARDANEDLRNEAVRVLNKFHIDH